MPDQLFARADACKAILDSLADGVFTVDREHRITGFNRAASRITGVAAADALGRTCSEVLQANLCGDAGNCPMRSCFAGEGAVMDRSVFITRADGSKIPVSISVAPLFDQTGSIIGGVETFRDLSTIHELRHEAVASHALENIVSRSAAIGRIFERLPRIARSDATVLLLGPSGTGKELFARATHSLSNRSDGPFVAVNCGAMPETLLESELFGYKSGAFTDARTDRPGRFAAAAGGTLFLDEIGDMPTSLQVKLLRVVQEKCYEPLGSVESIPTDVRIIAATNRDIPKLISAGQFRHDLYYRLNTVTLTLPSLAERREDVELLVHHFIERFNGLRGRAVRTISKRAMALLAAHDYPGNVRELENIIDYAFIMLPVDEAGAEANGVIDVEHLPDYLPGSLHTTGQQTSGNHGAASPTTMEEAKCEAVRAALARHDGARMAACRELGISKDTLRRIIERHGLEA